MAENTPDLAAVEPLKIVERPDDPHTDPLRIEYTVHPAPEKAESGIELPHSRWAADGADEHLNPQWDEWFQVVAGEFRVVFDEIDATLTEGEDIVVPANVPHRHWNPAGRPARIRYEARPGRQAAPFLETAYTLAQAGKTNADGFPNPLQFAVIMDAYPGYFYSTDLPRSFQRAVFTALAPIGRLLGYEATYSRDEIGELR